MGLRSAEGQPCLAARGRAGERLGALPGPWGELSEPSLPRVQACVGISAGSGGWMGPGQSHSGVESVCQAGSRTGPHALGTRQGLSTGPKLLLPLLGAAPLCWGFPLLYPATQLCPQNLCLRPLDPVWGFKAQGGVEGAREGLEQCLRQAMCEPLTPLRVQCTPRPGAPWGTWSPVPSQTRSGQPGPTSVALWPSTLEVALSGAPKTP